MAKNPIDGFTLTKDDFKFIGEDLQRPECILAEKNGDLWSADARGGVVRIKPDGSQEIITQSHDADAFQATDDESSKFVDGTLPNGLAFASNGDILISNFGTDCLERMTRTGETEVMFDTRRRRRDRQGQLRRPRQQEPHLDHRSRPCSMIGRKPSAPTSSDGRILLYEEGKGVRIVADDVALLQRVQARCERRMALCRPDLWSEHRPLQDC